MTGAQTYAELMLENRELRQKLYGVRKLSKCCGAILHPFISSSEKMCTECKVYYPWSLDHGQKALFNNGVG